MRAVCEKLFPCPTEGAAPGIGMQNRACGKPYCRRRVRKGHQLSARNDMLKFIGGTVGFIFLIGLLVVIGILMLIF